MQINFNPRDLTAAERVHVAAFIKSWPSSLADALIEEAPAHADKPNRPTFCGKTEVELLADENAADLQPLDAADDNTDKAAAQAAFTPSATPDRDGEGLPWDRRIHSSSKAINADSRWRIARNVSPELVKSVKAELRALVAAPVAEAAPLTEAAPLNPITQQPIAPPPPAAPLVTGAQFDAPVPPPPPAADGLFANLANAVAAIEATTPAILEAAQVPPPPAPAATPDAAAPDLPVMFAILLRDAGRAVADKLITSAELTAICQSHGVANVGLLAARNELVPQIDAQFRALLAGKVQP